MHTLHSPTCSALSSLWRVLALCGDAATASTLRNLVLLAHGGTIAYVCSRVRVICDVQTCV